MAPRSGLVLLPDGSGVRDRVKAALVGSEIALWPSARLGEADYVVVDLTAPGGDEALAGLLEREVGGAVVALLDASVVARRSAAGIESDSLIDLSRLEAELRWRLQKARVRKGHARQSQQRQSNLDMLLELTARYAESSDLDALFHEVTRRLAETLDVSRASLVVMDGADQGRVVAASDNPTLKDLRIDLDRYPEVRQCVRTGRPTVVDDVPSHPLLEGMHAQVAAAGVRSIAALPLTFQGKVLGVLLVRSSTERVAFTRAELDVLATVAHATAVALRNASIFENARDASEREKSARLDAERRASELSRYESFFAQVSEGIAILDARARVLVLNPAGAAILDLSNTRADAEGKTLSSLTLEVDSATLGSVLDALAAGRVQRDVDLAVRTRANRVLTLSVNGAPLGGGEGEAAAILSFRDVTAPRRMENELRRTKEFLEKLVDNTVDAVVALDMEGRFILFNKGAEALSGYTAQEAIGHLTAASFFVGPDVGSELLNRMRSEDHGGRGRLALTREEIITRAGERVPVNMTGSILYEGSEEVATVGILTDLRDRVQLERKLSDATLRLERSERSAEMIALAGTAAHELNQPLTSVLGYAELLMRKLSQEDFAWAKVEIIHKEAERMKEIVRKIGRITRYETKPYVGESRILDLERASDEETSSPPKG